MKNAFLLFIVCALIAGGLYAAYSWYASLYLEDGAYMTTSSFKADKVSRLESLGVDSRIYEFTPRTNSKMQCVYVADSRGTSVTCFNK